MKTFFKTILILILFIPGLCQAQEMSVETAQKKFDSIQIKGKGIFKVIDEKAVKLANGDVITSSLCFCDSMPGYIDGGLKYFPRRYGITTKAGKKLDPLYEYIQYWENDQYLVKYSEVVPMYSFLEDNWFFLIDRNFKVLRVYAREGISDTGYRIKKGGKYGAVNDELAEVIPFMYDSIGKHSVLDEAYIMYKERSFPTYAAMQNKKWGIVSVQNDSVISFKYEYLDNFSSGKSPAKMNGKWGVINVADSAIVPFMYDSVYRHEWAYVAMKNKKLALFNEGLEIKKLVFQYDEIMFNSSAGGSFARIGSKWYFLNTEKIKETDPGYDGFYFDKDSGPFVCVKKGDMYAIYERYKGLKTEFIYSKIVDVVCKRASDETYYGYTEYPVYYFKVIQDGKEVELKFRD